MEDDPHHSKSAKLNDIFTLNAFMGVARTMFDHISGLYGFANLTHKNSYGTTHLWFLAVVSWFVLV